MAFCGHELFCAEFGGEAALARAKENVERFYTVVGVLEDMNRTLEVFEAAMPDTFVGAKALYLSDREIERKQMRNAYKLPVAEDTMAAVRANFTREIEFYEFVKQRLHDQHERLVMGNK